MSSIGQAMEDALKTNKENIPAVLNFEVSPMEFCDGFKDFHEKVWFSGSGGAA